MSCGAKPRSQAASSATTRAGGSRSTLKNSLRSVFIKLFLIRPQVLTYLHIA
jgi:hypothetical protein